jgi:hypothetical protein
LMQLFVIENTRILVILFFIPSDILFNELISQVFKWKFGYQYFYYLRIYKLKNIVKMFLISDDGFHDEKPMDLNCRGIN